MIVSCNSHSNVSLCVNTVFYTVPRGNTCMMSIVWQKNVVVDYNNTLISVSIRQARQMVLLFVIICWLWGQPPIYAAFLSNCGMDITPVSFYNQGLLQSLGTYIKQSQKKKIETISFIFMPYFGLVIVGSSCRRWPRTRRIFHVGQWLQMILLCRI